MKASPLVVIAKNFIKTAFKDSEEDRKQGQALAAKDLALRKKIKTFLYGVRSRKTRNKNSL